MIRAFAILAAVAIAGSAVGQNRSIVEPPFGIFDAKLGGSVAQIPALDVNDLACGTNGGPPSRPMKDPADFLQCKPEQSGLREIHFSYDDELDYVARAMESEYAVLQDGTSVFAHPVVVSVLADPEGIVQGIRIMTDARVGLQDRRRAVSLMRNLSAKYSTWSLDCVDFPLAENEKKIGNLFVKQTCSGQSPDGTSTIRLDARYLRKPGQTAVNRETRAVNSSYFEGFTRLEIVAVPYEPAPPPIKGVQ